MNIQKIIGTAFLVCGLCYAIFIGRDKSLPSCLIASTIVPGAVIAFSFLKAGNSVDWSTLILWMICLALGGIFGARAMDHMNGAVIKKVMGIALVFSLAALVIKMIVTSGASGEATGLRGRRLVIMCIMCLVIGFINMLGVPTKPAATALLLLLGLSPLTTLTLILVLGCITPMSGGASIVRSARYNGKMVLAAMTAGSAAAILGCYMAISLNALLLNIILISVMIIAIISIFRK